MAHVLRVSATEFSRGFGKFREEAFTAEVIEVTSHGRVIGAYLSPKELERYRRLRQEEREVLSVSEFDDQLLADLKGARYGVVGR